MIECLISCYILVKSLWGKGFDINVLLLWVREGNQRKGHHVAMTALTQVQAPGPRPQGIMLAADLGKMSQYKATSDTITKMNFLWPSFLHPVCLFASFFPSAHVCHCPLSSSFCFVSMLHQEVCMLGRE